MTTAATATQRSTWRLPPVRGCLRMSDLPAATGGPVLLQNGSSASVVPKMLPSIRRFIRTSTSSGNQAVRGVRGSGRRRGSRGGTARGRGAQTTQSSTNQGGIGGSPERGQRSAQEVTVARGHQPRVQDGDHAAVAHR